MADQGQECEGDFVFLAIFVTTVMCLVIELAKSILEVTQYVMTGQAPRPKLTSIPTVMTNSAFQDNVVVECDGRQEKGQIEESYFDRRSNVMTESQSVRVNSTENVMTTRLERDLQYILKPVARRALTVFPTCLAAYFGPCVITWCVPGVTIAGTWHVAGAPIAGGLMNVMMNKLWEYYGW